MEASTPSTPHRSKSRPIPRRLRSPLALFLAGAVGLAPASRLPAAETLPPVTSQTLAGEGQPGAADSPAGTPIHARFYRPEGLAIDPQGRVVIADTENRTIRRLELDGSVITLAGAPQAHGHRDGPGPQARFGGPASVAVNRHGHLYVADSLNHVIRHIDPDGLVSTLAGQPTVPGYREGTGSEARFDIPAGVAVDDAGQVFVADRSNHVIRVISPAGEVRLWAGAPRTPGFVDGPPAIARFRGPTAVATARGAVYVADTSNNAIRRIDPDGITRTVGGWRSVAGYLDGSALDSRFNYPRGVAVDPLGNVLVADTANHLLRQIDPAGRVTTRAGTPEQRGRYEATGVSARFNEPRGIACGPDGRVVIADTWNHQVRVLNPGFDGGTWEVVPPLATPGVPRRIRQRPPAPGGLWTWQWLRQPPGSTLPVPAPGESEVTLVPELPGLYTLLAETLDPAGLVCRRVVEWMVVDQATLPAPEVLDGRRVQFTLPGGPGLEADLEGRFGHRWAFLTNVALPARLNRLEDPLGANPTGRLYRIRFRAQP